MKIQTLALAAVIAAAPFAANAVTGISASDFTGNPDQVAGAYDAGVNCGDDLFLGAFEAQGGAGSATVIFEACETPVDGNAIATVNIAAAGTFANLTMSWGDETATITDGVGGLISGTEVSLFTEFTAANPTRELEFTWTDSVNKVGFDFAVDITPVPVPAGFLLLGTALAGFGLIRRKA